MLVKELFALSLGQVNVLIFGVAFILVVSFLPEGLIALIKGVDPRRSRPLRPAVRGEASEA